MTWAEQLHAIECELQPAAAQRAPWRGIPQVVNETALTLSLVLNQPLPAESLPGPLQLGLNPALPPLFESLSAWPGAWELLFCQPETAEASSEAGLRLQRAWQRGALRKVPGMSADTLWQQAPALSAGTWLLRVGIAETLNDALANRSRLINRQSLWTPEHQPPAFEPPALISNAHQQQRRRHLLVISTGAAHRPEAIAAQTRMHLEAWRQAGFRLLLLPGRASRRQVRTCLRHAGVAPSIAWISWLPSDALISCAGLDQLRSAAPARPLLIDRRCNMPLPRWRRPRPRAGLTERFPFQRSWTSLQRRNPQTLNSVILGWRQGSIDPVTDH